VKPDKPDKQRDTEADLTFTQLDRLTVLTRDDFRCRWCGASAATGAELHVDHIWPESKGGVPMPINGQTLCGPCNMAKQNKLDPAGIVRAIIENSVSQFAAKSPAPSGGRALPLWWKAALREGMEWLDAIGQESTRNTKFRVR